MFCSNCGTELLEGQKFCYKCGSKQLGVDQSSSNVSTNVSASSRVRKKIDKKKMAFIAVLVVAALLLFAVGGYIFKSISSKVKVAELNERGNSYFDEGDYDSAVDCFRLAISMDNNSEEAYKGLMKTYRKLEDYSSFYETIWEAYDTFESEYFTGVMDICEPEMRMEDLVNAWEIRESVLADIADGVIKGSGEMEAVAGCTTTLSETYIGVGGPARGYNFIAKYDANRGTCIVTLNGYTLTTEEGAKEYKNARF